MMGMRKTIFVGFAAAAIAQWTFAQSAALPAAYTGPWRDAVPPDGWTFSGLGAPDYAPGFDGFGDGAAKLDDAGDFISVHFDLPPESVSFWIRGYTFSGGVVRVDQSIDGTNWQALASYAPPPTNATFQTFDLMHHARHVRFLYVSRVTGNVGLDGISVAKNASFVIDRLSQTGNVARVWVLPTEVGREYALQVSTNLQATNSWTGIFSSEGTGGELELIDFYFESPRFYRVVDVTPPGRKTAVRRPAKTPWRR